jgi:hypothetical protein
MISGMPIGVGDSVRVILIKKSAYSLGTGISCYPWDFWSPVSPPFRGKYDDYARVALEAGEKDLVDFVLGSLASVHVPVELGENEYHDIAVPNIQTWEMVENACIEGRLVFKNSYSKVPTSPVNRVLIREDVWQSFLGVESYGDYPVRTMKFIQDGALESFEPFVGIGANERELRFAKMMAEGFQRDKIPFPLYFGGEGYSYIIKDQIIGNAQNNIANGTWTMTSPVLRQLVDSLVELAYMSGQMRSPGHMWAPMMTSGQEEHWDNVVRFYKNMVAIATVKAEEEAAERAKWAAEEKEILAEIRAKKAKKKKKAATKAK